MPYWVICEAFIAGPFADETAVATFVDRVICCLDHMVVQAAEKPILVDVTAELV